jgi:hypothetical protein
VFLQEIHDCADLYKACSLITDLHEQHPSKQLSLNLTLYLTEEVSELVRPTPSPVAASSQDPIDEAVPSFRRGIWRKYWRQRRPPVIGYRPSQVDSPV